MTSISVLENDNRLSLIDAIMELNAALGYDTLREAFYDLDEDQLKHCIHVREIQRRARAEEEQSPSRRFASTSGQKPSTRKHTTGEIHERFVMIPEDVLRNLDLSSGAKVLYMFLLSHAREKPTCYPKEATLADEMGLKTRQIRNLMTQLIGAGLVTIEHTDRRRNNTYHLHRQVQRH
jgi:hypothetical protein